MAVDGVMMAIIDFENPWIVGAILIVVWILVSLATEMLLLSGNIREALIRGIFGGSAFAAVYLVLRWRYGKDEL